MRDQYWDIVKAIGIISIILGHAGILVQEVNWYHISIFFFVSGFFISEEKCLKYSSFFEKKIKGLYFPFCITNITFFLIQNQLINLNFIGLNKDSMGMVGRYLDKYELLQSIANVIFGGLVNVMSGALWFICPFLLNILLFGGIIYLNNKYKLLIKYKYKLLFIECIILSVLGSIIVRKHIILPFHMGLSLLLIIITMSGYIIKYKYNKIYLKIKGYYILPILIVIYFFEKNNINISLGGYNIGNYGTFVLVSGIGIIFVLYLSKLMYNIKLIRHILSYIGKKSYWIMALHFLGFKIVSIIYITIYNQKIDKLNMYVINDGKMGWIAIYILMGIFIPIIFSYVYNKILRIRSKNEKKIFI